MKHVPVLFETVLDLLDPQPGETVLDVTVGLGGHAKGFLEKIGPKGKFIGVDADEENLKNAGMSFGPSAGLPPPLCFGRAGRASSTQDKLQCGNAQIKEMKNVSLIHGNFGEVLLAMRSGGGARACHFDVIFADLGLSSPHLDNPERGFSFRGDGPLDMRFDQTRGETATELLQRCSFEELQGIFEKYGELPRSRALAEAIVMARARAPLQRTHDLVAIVNGVYGFRSPKMLPQIFQALRIAVNDELSALQSLLVHAPGFLQPGGRMGIISYNSLEDALVKERFRELTTPPKHPLTGAPLSPPPFLLLTKKPIRPTLEETRKNPRARSARFRAIRSA